MRDVLCNLISFLIACDVACDAMSRMSSWSRQKQQLLYYYKYYVWQFWKFWKLEMRTTGHSP